MSGTGRKFANSRWIRLSDFRIFDSRNRTMAATKSKTRTIKVGLPFNSYSKRMRGLPVNVTGSEPLHFLGTDFMVRK